MLSMNIPENVKNILNEITPQFEENLKENFTGEGDRIRRKNKRHHLDSVFISNGNVNIDLSNLSVATPLFALKKFEINLGMLNVYVEADLGQLIVEGDLKQSTTTTLVPMVRSGKVMFVLEDVVLKANAGIYIVEDSFMAVNYDFNIKPMKIISKVSCYDGDKVEVFESSDTDIEESLAKHIWRQLLDVFHWDLFYPQLSGTICEQSVSELLLDEPEEMRQISTDRAREANSFVDSLLNLLNEHFKESNQTLLNTPPLTVPITKEGKSQYGIFESLRGELDNLSTFKRETDMSVYEEQNTQYIYGKIKLKDFKFKYVSCKAKYGPERSTNGAISVSAYRSEIFIKLSLQKKGDEIDYKINKIKVLKLRDIDFDMVNLECLSSERDQINNWVLGSLRGLVFPELENKIVEGLSNVIMKVK